ncbi:MAG: DUF2059 domain-containing protein [Gammaproteobacteria bacterium]|nr:DUF2059 domain-containing protein [Gammaproteobacteria bacterium]
MKPSSLLLLGGLVWFGLGFGPALAEPVKGSAEVQELLELNGGERQYQQLLGMMTQSLETSFSAGLAKALKDRPIAPGQRQQARQILDRNFARFIREFQQQMQQLMPWERLVSEVYTPVYLRHFSPAELAELLAFYRSPAGRKFVSRNPQLVQDASEAIKKLYAKQMQGRAEQLTEQTLKQIASELDGLK